MGEDEPGFSAPLYQQYKYTWFFENRVNETFIFFEVVLILRLNL